MRVKKLIVAADELGSPDSDVWRATQGESVSLVQAPPSMQPAKYISAKWQATSYGANKKLMVKGLHNATDIAFRLEWQSKTGSDTVVDNTDFPDAVAMLFPLSEQSPLIMGGEGAPVSLWHWRADAPTKVRSNLASGIGTSQLIDTNPVAAQARHRDGYWAVVLRRSLLPDQKASEAIQFIPGQGHRATFAIWDGANRERAGLKAFSPSWINLSLDA